jgi:hypothetical protein
MRIGGRLLFVFVFDAALVCAIAAKRGHGFKFGNLAHVLAGEPATTSPEHARVW